MAALLSTRSVLCDPYVSIEQFFEAPVVNHDWKITRKDTELVRFGLLWKVYDLVALKGTNFSVPILDVGISGLLIRWSQRYPIPS